MNQIYLLYSCDAWKSHTSMNLLMASTIRESIDDLVCEKLLSGDMTFRGLKGKAAVAAYSADPDTRTLSFGYLESVGDGERL